MQQWDFHEPGSNDKATINPFFMATPPNLLMEWPGSQAFGGYRSVQGADGRVASGVSPGGWAALAQNLGGRLTPRSSPPTLCRLGALQFAAASRPKPHHTKKNTKQRRLIPRRRPNQTPQLANLRDGPSKIGVGPITVDPLQRRCSGRETSQ